MWKNIKPKLHNRPKHLLQDDSYYFITVRTLDAQWFLQPDKYKRILLDKLKEKTNKYGIPLIAFAVLHNHYHLIIHLDQSTDLPKLMKEINGSSSSAINDADGVVSLKIWWNFYDHVIRDESDFFKHLNYIHQNPVKHGVSESLSYRFSSYDGWVKKKGQEYLDDSFRKYPIVDFLALNDEF